jgi:hypothetical protein
MHVQEQKLNELLQLGMFIISLFKSTAKPADRAAICLQLDMILPSPLRNFTINFRETLE